MSGTQPMPALTRYRAEVVQPRRRSVGAAVGGDHEVCVTVARVDEAVGPGRARAAAGRPEQQGRDADHAVPDAPVGPLVELLVEAEYLARDAHRLRRG